jgi:hypothetical protein
MTAHRRAGAAIMLLLGVILASALLFGADAAAAATSGPSDPPGVTLTGCSGSGSSMDSSGAVLQNATAPNPPSSRDHPLLIDPNGTVHYQGSSAAVITDHHWSVEVYGMTIMSGGSANSGHRTSSEGTVKVGSHLPFEVSGPLLYVSGGISGSGGSCAGSMWIKLTGSPVGTVPWYLGIVLAAGGLVALFFARPRVVA